MLFGVREICDVVFKANQKVKIGNTTFEKGEPVLYIDTAKTSTIEGAATTVYATGGKGNSRLIGWESERTLTFTVEDALLSPMGFAVLSGAGLIDSDSNNYQVHVGEKVDVDDNGEVELENVISDKAPLFVKSLDKGSLGVKISGVTVDTSNTKKIKGLTAYKNQPVYVDYYTSKTGGLTEIQIDAGNFAGYYYVEASTLFRREEDSIDLPAEIIFPRVKVQSNFTFNLSASGDPGTFSFTMDAFPAYTMFDKSKKVLCAMQILDDSNATETTAKAVTSIEGDEDASQDINDSRAS